MIKRARVAPFAALGLALAGSLALAGPGAAGPVRAADSATVDSAKPAGSASATAGGAAVGDRSGSAGGRAPLHRVASSSAIPGRYIVVLEDGADRNDRSSAVRRVRAMGGQVTHEYKSALNGFAAELPATAVDALRDNPTVRYIEQDARMRAFATQRGAPWGLDRVDQRNRPLNGKYTYARGGAGVTAYVIDTGIRKTHKQFGSRVKAGFNTISDGRGTNDCNGHGTHVAGTIGAAKYGIAKGVTLRPVRVLDCRGGGDTSGVLAGVDWVTGHHTGAKPAVANMSLGGEPSEVLDEAILESMNDGVTYILAAGNENMNACAVSPARVGPAITVGSTTKTDARSGFSNWGPCLDVFAPGSGIKSTWFTSNTATKTISGTSMASPHVAGVAALMLQQKPASTPYLVGESLLKTATTGKVGNRAGSPNRLLFSKGAVSVPPSTSGNLLTNGGFEAGAGSGWAGSSPGVVTNFPGAMPYTGFWKAWLNGYGTVNVNTLAQSVSLPSSSNISLSFQLMIGSDEGTGTAYDTLRLDVVSGSSTQTVGQWSNRQQGQFYVRRTVNLTPYAGQNVTLRWTGTEDNSNFTAFIIDHVVLKAS